MKQKIKVAVLDMYMGVANEGIRSIKLILSNFSKNDSVDLSITFFDVRNTYEVPSAAFDIYISSGGPGSPLIQNLPWEIKYFNLFNTLAEYNKTSEKKKYMFLICHSFQVIMNHLKLAEVALRHSPAFGIFPVHKTTEGKNSAILSGVNNPFYAVDSREWQVIKPNTNAIKKMGAEILCIEKERLHVPYERAVMGLKFSNEIIGFQFHPEADVEGMYTYFARADKKDSIIKNHGKEKYDEMIEFLSDPGKIECTHNAIIPSFLESAIRNILAEKEKV